jgi:hypothetical protein
MEVDVVQKLLKVARETGRIVDPLPLLGLPVQDLG